MGAVAGSDHVGAEIRTNAPENTAVRTVGETLPEEASSNSTPEAVRGRIRRGITSRSDSPRSAGATRTFSRAAARTAAAGSRDRSYYRTGVAKHVGRSLRCRMPRSVGPVACRQRDKRWSASQVRQVDTSVIAVLGSWESPRCIQTVRSNAATRRGRYREVPGRLFGRRAAIIKNGGASPGGGTGQPGFVSRSMGAEGGGAARQRHPFGPGCSVPDPCQGSR